jgi:hypothetical protein
MHQSYKERLVTSGEQQLLHGIWAERINQSSAFGDVNLTANFTSMQEALRGSTRKIKS